MTTPEERAAAERLRAIANGKPKNVVYGPLSVYEDVEDAMQRDQRTLASALLRESREDGEEPISEEWLKKVGGENRSFFGEGIELRVIPCNIFFDGIELWQDGDGILALFKKEGLVRSDLRDLCRVLKIPLTEKPA